MVILLFDSQPDIAHELVDGGWLMPDRLLEAYFSDWGEEPNTIYWKEELNSYAYFDFYLPDWQAVPSSRVHYHKVVMSRFLSWLSALCNIAIEPTQLIDAGLWHMGTTPILNESCHIYFVRACKKLDFIVVTAETRQRARAYTWAYFEFI